MNVAGKSGDEKIDKWRKRLLRYVSKSSHFANGKKS